ncbi:glycosyltransferase [Maridesulfovibrio sp.]|uniref:glycosyltransferase n=1 Tax=Maridesulfovibrio sp. TaxID=2795000 RepID=UPI0029CA17C1|nr:glycosyltransferase [Maridesulfovibrio sp.]
MPAPLISVCSFCYNRKEFIPDLISSILSQLTDECEFIIVDDGSTDGTDEICKAEERIRYFWQENQGRPVARNKCLELARGEYVIWVGSDDQLAPRIIAHYLNKIKNKPQCDIITGAILVSNARLQPLERRSAPLWVEQPDQLVPAMVFKDWISDGGTLVRRELYSIYGGYDPDFKVCQDYEWFSRIVGNARICHTPADMLLWRIHNSGRAGDKDLSPYESEVSARIIRRVGLKRACPDVGWGRLPDHLAEAAACLKLGMRFIELTDARRCKRLFSHAANLAKGTDLASTAHEFLVQALKIEQEVPSKPEVVALPTDPLERLIQN